jgi:hypothetical protein
VARRPEACVRTPLSIRISARASFPRAGRGRDHHLAGGGSGPDDIGRTTKQWRSSNRCPAWRHPRLNCRRIECCLRHHPRPSAPSPHQAPPQPMSRARDMGPLPSRGARSAPQPRVRRNGEIRRKRIYLHMREWHLRLDGSLRVSAKRKPTASPSYAGNIVYRNPLRAGG